MVARRRSPRSLATFALAAAVLALAAPHAGAMAGYGMQVSQELLARDGDPLLVANFSPDGSLATPSWAVCAPGAPTCTPAGVTNRLFSPGPEPAGTTFEASAVYGGVTYAARSDPWQGAGAATAPPTLTGAPKIGAVVTPHAGAWSGGWPGDFDLLHVEACRTRDGRGCTTIAHPRAPLHGLRAPLDPRWSGRWLFALDERYGPGTAFASMAFGSPVGIPPTPPGPTVSRSAPLGPVTGPALALRDHPLLQLDDRLLIGRATCAGRCRVTLRVATGRTSAHAALALRGTRNLTVPAAALHLEDGATIRVRIDGTPLVQTFVAAHQVVAARVRTGG
jgi:hypothetical protein